jgi:hypothetical protein
MASGNRQPRKGAPNAGSGKRAWRTPIPHLSRFDRKVGPGLIVFKNGADFRDRTKIVDENHSAEEKNLPLRCIRHNLTQTI